MSMISEELWRGRMKPSPDRKVMLEIGYTNVYDLGGIIDWPFETVSGK